MDNQREINRALCDGETVVHSNGDLTRYSKEDNQETSGNGGEAWERSWHLFDNPRDWQIYTKPDWREELNGKETLCRVRDNDTQEWLKVVITSYRKINRHKFNSELRRWTQCKRLTKEEIQPLMDNAPSDHDE